MFVDLKMAFFLCITMTLFTCSYDTTTPPEIPWQVATQGAIGDRYAGDQLQVANVANQGNAKNSMLIWQKKLAGMARLTSVLKKHRTIMQHVATGGNQIPAINVIRR